MPDHADDAQSTVQILRQRHPRASLINDIGRQWLIWPKRHQYKDPLKKQLYNEDLVEDFVSFILSKERTLYKDDVQAAFLNLRDELTDALTDGSRKSVLAGLVDRVFRENLVRVQLVDGRPMVGRRPERRRRTELGMPHQGGLEGVYEQFIARIGSLDGDALMALPCADEVFGRGDSDRILTEARSVLSKWTLNPPLHDNDLTRLLDRGVSDLHIHFKSGWPVALTWQRLLLPRTHPERLLLDQIGYFTARAGQAHRNPRDIDRQTIEDVLTHFCGLPVTSGDEGSFIKMGLAELRALRRLGSVDSDSIIFMANRRGRMPVPLPVNEVLGVERLMLMTAWRHLEAEHFRSVGPEPCSREEFELGLDAYIRAKSLLKVHLTQPLGEAPSGLVAFDETRKANSHNGRFGNEEFIDNFLVPKLYRYNNGPLLANLLETRRVKRIEMRVAPPDVDPGALPQAYMEMARAFDILVKDLQKAGRNDDARVSDAVSEKIRPLFQYDPEISLGIHFKRMIGKKPKRLANKELLPTGMALIEKFGEFDRETAALQIYRVRAFSATQSQEEKNIHREAANRIRRIDLAGPERGAAPHWLAPYARMLRGDTDLVKWVASKPDHPGFRYWRQAIDQGFGSLPVAAPRLHMTVHGGEDFYTLADGLMNMDMAVETLRLESGDGIGHGLALNLDPLLWADRSLAAARPTRGTQFDSLLWLYTVSNADEPPARSGQEDLERWLRSEANDIYAEGKSKRAYVSLPDLEEKMACLYEPLALTSLHDPDKWGRQTAAEREEALREMPAGLRLISLDLIDEEVCTKRAKQVPAHRVHRAVAPLIAQAQQRLKDKILSRGISIETNPSSNLRMLYYDHIRNLPIPQMLADNLKKDRREHRVTVCTDNPGTYDVSIETEYGLLFEALQQLHGPGSREVVLAELERLRRVGLEWVN